MTGPFIIGDSDRELRVDPNIPDLADDRADPNEVLHHITVSDIDRLAGMSLTENHAEQIKDRLAHALTDAINEIRGIDPNQLTSD